MEVVVSIAAIILLVALVAITTATCLFIYFVYKLLGGKPIQPLTSFVNKEDTEDEAFVEEELDTQPLDQFTPDFNKPIGVKVIDEEEDGEN